MGYEVGDINWLRDVLSEEAIHTGGELPFEWAVSLDRIHELVDNQTDHEKTAGLTDGKVLRYNVGDKVVLEDWSEEVTIKSKGFYKGYYEVDVSGGSLAFKDVAIDHEKTAELNDGGGIKSWVDEFEYKKTQAESSNIQPKHYNKGLIDLYESAYQTRPFNEYRAIMEFTAERYIKRVKLNRVEDIEKAIYTLERLKEKEKDHEVQSVHERNS